VNVRYTSCIYRITYRIIAHRRESHTDPSVWLVVRGRLETVQQDGLDRVAQSVRVTVAATEQATQRHS